jgi:FixJ family two-component response regulator
MGELREPTLLVVDDDARVLAAIAREMSRTCEVIPCPTAAAALRAADETGTHIDCAAVDINLGRGPDGIELLESLRRRRPSLPALVFTGDRTLDADVWYRFAALRPAPWVALKPDVLEKLRHVLAVAPIAALLDAPDSTVLADAVHAEAQSRDLSPRERQAFALVVRGDTAEVIAQKLGIKVSSVETYLANLRAKLGRGGARDIRRTILDRAANATVGDELLSSLPTREAEVTPPHR